MFEADSFENCLVELQPFGSFPASSLKDILKVDLPEYEKQQELPRIATV